ncbi:MAG: hypothetical protein ABL877_11255 [Thiobacillus sp.]
MLLLVACDGTSTGTRMQTLPLEANAGGGYGPVALQLAPEMSPVALNLKAKHSDDPTEVGKWNTYRATLSQNGETVAEGEFHINHTGSPEAPMGATYVTQTMLVAKLQQAGTYELRINPVRPEEVTLSEVELELRSGVRDAASVERSQLPEAMPAEPSPPVTPPAPSPTQHAI